MQSIQGSMASHVKSVLSVGRNREVNPKAVGSFLKTYLHTIFALFAQAFSQEESMNIQLRTFLPDDPTSRYFPEITSSN